MVDYPPVISDRVITKKTINQFTENLGKHIILKHNKSDFIACFTSCCPFYHCDRNILSSPKPSSTPDCVARGLHEGLCGFVWGCEEQFVVT